jgi:cytidylate kinase
MDLNEFSKHVNENPEIDREIDGTLRAIVKGYAEPDNRITITDVPVEPRPSEVDHLLVESRLAGWIAGEYSDLSVWLNASRELRKQRAQDGDESPDEVIQRAWDERMRYDCFYGIDLDDKEIYDLTINTAKWSPTMISSTITSLIEQFKPYHDETIVTSPPRPSASKQFDSLIPDRLYVNS